MCKKKRKEWDKVSCHSKRIFKYNFPAFFEYSESVGNKNLKYIGMSQFCKKKTTSRYPNNGSRMVILKMVLIKKEGLELL